ncbi:hypothetical protein CWATWH0402_158 [Crocosphaera watsonii WH 0402]|uniref:Uncharacterized protein n=1 Tax=Crocosphaera watsonii WH 0402 TaxID=1284629 RepID=T2JW09_CROWT|nr:hypothetical protein CWATWH0402_158 [Crocosphaera watsonii WH 0402]
MSLENARGMGILIVYYLIFNSWASKIAITAIKALRNNNF